MNFTPFPGQALVWLVVLTLAGNKLQQNRSLPGGGPAPPKKHDYEPSRGRRPNSGYFGLQNHSDKDTFYFKEVAVKENH